MRIPGPDDPSEQPQRPEQLDADRREGVGWDLIFDLMAMIAELKSTDGIVEVDFQIYDPVPVFTIETIEHGLGVRVPERIKSFYRVTDGLDFSWSYTGPDGQIVPGGGARICDFATVFDNWLDVLWRAEARHDEDQHSEDQQDFFWSLRGFDQYSAPDSDDMVVMCVEEEYPTYDLFVHDLASRESRLLDLSFGEYFECLIASRGTHGWRIPLTEGADTDAPEFSDLAERFFPDTDFGRWNR
ncbi:MAG: hypothetical protein ACLFVJ_06825 [Persicimonas sp.]